MNWFFTSLNSNFSYEAVLAEQLDISAPPPEAVETQPLQDNDADADSSDGLIKPSLCFTVLSAICFLPLGVCTIICYNRAIDAYQKRKVQRLDRWAAYVKWSGCVSIFIGQFSFEFPLKTLFFHLKVWSFTVLSDLQFWWCICSTMLKMIFGNS